MDTKTISSFEVTSLVEVIILVEYKILKRVPLSNYCSLYFQFDSSCQCQEWKPTSSTESQALPTLLDLCRTCQHTLEAHVLLVKELDDDSVDQILLIVYDMDNIYLQMKNEREDQDLRKTYSFLFNFLKKNMLQSKLPSLAGDKLGTPPFGKVSIAKVCGAVVQ